MHIIHVVPIARGIPFDTLTYYHNEPLENGTFVFIPLGRQTIVGIVTETSTLLEAKALVKGATFSLKKIKSVIAHIPFFGHVIAAAKETGAQTLSPIGAILASVMPSMLFDYINADKVTDLFAATTKNTPMKGEDVVVGTEQDRADLYKRIIRSSFASKQSVLFIAPTIRAVEHWKTILEKGIAKHVIVLHSKVTKKNLRSAFSLVKTSDRPLIIFTTPGYMITPRSDFGLIIAEEESTNLYKTSDRYTTDLRIFIKQFALCAELKLQWGDVMPRFETLERLEKTHLPRTYVPDKLHVVPIEHYRTILPTEVMELIRHAEKKKRRLFIYTNRKGVAPLSRCSDCGTIVTCDDCSLPMVLRNKVLPDGTRERFFVCTHCGGTLPASHLCTYCGSWNITPVSIGTESVRDAVISLVGAEPVITIDDDLTPDAKAIEDLIAQTQKQKFAIVIGTVKVLPYLKGIHYALFPFFDRLLSIPSLYTTEEALRLVMECNERVSDGVILCTKNPDFPFLKQLETQKINAIIFDELSIRKDLGYPPYGAIIKISFTVPDGHRERVMTAITDYFATKTDSGIEITPLPVRRISHGSMKVLLSWIVRAPATYIEEDGPELLGLAESLRFPYKIEQNPERL
jgi:primosomal protein N'